MTSSRPLFRLLLPVVTFVMVASVRSAEACAVCYGAAGDKVNEAMAMAILGMLIVLMCVLGSFVGFFFYLSHRGSHVPAHLTDLGDLDYAGAKDLGN